MKDEGLETMNISVLRGHVSQLAQSISQVALKPGEEEIKKKAGGSSGNNRLCIQSLFVKIIQY